ncbi:hypothetical protein TELCIR_16270, partial [Teladorsagia circumcincta]
NRGFGLFRNVMKEASSSSEERIKGGKHQPGIGGGSAYPPWALKHSYPKEKMKIIKTHDSVLKWLTMRSPVHQGAEHEQG